MRLSFLIALIYFSITALVGQTNRSVVLIEPNNTDQWRSGPIQLFEPTAAFLAVSALWNGEAEELMVRYSENARNWSDWENWTPDAHANDGQGGLVGQLLFVDAKNDYIQVAARKQVNSIELHFYDPGKSKNDAGATQSPALEKDVCPCPQPEYLDRVGWCPTGDCPNNPNQPSTVTTHLIVHHSASANSASDWSAVVRSIWDFHVNTRGWADIGYNWLIAPTGQVFEGRGDDIQGAHFGCSENPNGNINTTGVCMIGTFTTETPTAAARNSLKMFLAWKACDADIDPEGISIHAASGLLLNHISGHRQGCSTECPGNAFFPLLEEVREETAAYIGSSCNGVASPTQLAAENTGTGGVELTWTDNTEDEIAFELERSKALPNNFSMIASLDPNTTTYIDNDVNPNSGYYYRVRALTETDTSAYSNEDFIFTSPTGTTDLLDLGKTALFPNPANSFIWLEMENELRGDMTLEVLNVNSQLAQAVLVVEKPGAVAKFQIPLKKIPAGIYWLRISQETGVAILPFVVE